MSETASFPLVIISCGRRKIWSAHPDIGPVVAWQAYTGSLFRMARHYAEWYVWKAGGGRWLILSAKYGLIDPEFAIPGPYDVTFDRPGTGPIIVEQVRQQVITLGLHTASPIIGVGGKAYRRVLTQVFAPNPVHYPFEGLPVGKMMQAMRRAIRFLR